MFLDPVKSLKNKYLVNVSSEESVTIHQIRPGDFFFNTYKTCKRHCDSSIDGRAMV